MEQLASAEKSRVRIEEEKDRVYRSALKEKAQAEYESNSRQVELVSLKEQLRVKSVEICNNKLI